MRYFLMMLVFYPILSGCAYNTAVSTINTADVYSAYEEKIPGTFALIIDIDADLLNRTIKPASVDGYYFKYPIVMSSAFIASVKSVSESIFEGIVEKRTIPSLDEMDAGGLSGYILVKMKHFEPRVTIIPRFMAATASSSVDIAFDFTIKDKNNAVLLSSGVSASRTAEGDSGLSGSGGADIIALASEKALKDALERYAERISNSNKVREALSEVHGKSPVKGKK